jgi:hypothetical protein
MIMNCEMQEMATQGINIHFPKRIKLCDNFFLTASQHTWVNMQQIYSTLNPNG